ncbi:probable G-protein coupled receptor 63 [Trichonephila clavata]|uniref:Probable G-protein coupled receptor 63 n=1 Tax=Trichonephila clavata TaxID=2740835 RepID=A0A8X6LA45_TRICU|nr:probable G-protein coupled receptor 63 [Trichonephila clavata]
MNSSDNETVSCNTYQSDGVRIALSIVLIFAILVGGAGNLLLTFLVIRRTQMHSVINILLSLMSISDAFLSTICAPLDLVTIITDKWMFGTCMCSVHGFLLSVFVVQNVTLLVIISIDRYYILIHKKNRLTSCNSISLISGCLIFSIAVSSPPLFGSGQFTFGNEHCGQLVDHGMDAVIYYGLYSSLLFVLPCGLLLLAYGHIIIALKKSNFTVQPECCRSRRNELLKSRLDINVRFKQKTFSTILYLYAAAMTFKLPLAFTLLVKSITYSIECPVSLRVVVFVYLNGAVNSFIYAFKITPYWMVLTGKFQVVKQRVNSMRSNGKNDRQSVYRITSRVSTSSVI